MLSTSKEYKKLFDRIKTSNISLEDQKTIIGVITQSKDYSLMLTIDKTGIDLSNYTSK